MTFLENLSNKAKTLSETTSLNGIIKTEERKIASHYEILGQLYFEKYGNSPESEFAESVAVINEAKAKIAETKEKLENLQNRNKCPNCKKEFKPGAGFCSACGTALPNNAPTVPGNKTCSKCGTVLPTEAQFCNNCGNKLTSQTVQPQSVQAVTPAPTPAPIPTEVPEVTPISVPAAETLDSVQNKFCPKCGTKAQTNDVFCDNCGFKL